MNAHDPAPSAAPSLGPVPRLQDHLPADWWRTLFTATYLKTDGDVVENAEITRHEVNLLLGATGFKPTDRLLDLCCGQGRHSLELAARGFQNLSGVDRSQYLIRLARKRAKALGLPVRFSEGDARRFRFDAASLDGVFLMGNSFGYFERQEEDLEVLRAIHDALRPGGTMALDLTDGGWLARKHEPRSWEWIGPRELVVRERELGPCRRRLVCREIIVHADKGVTRDQFYAERLYTRGSIRKLLHAAGLENVICHGPQQGSSDRNQDLGMMAQRMFITARRPLEKARAPRTIAVLLGDPSLPDPVKRDERFNPEDAATVAHLKRALAEIPGHTFHFLDHHPSLLTTLRDLEPDLALNFCDEGFRNQPAMEAHVPALLEMLNIPFTGSAPASLLACYHKRHVRNLASDLNIPTPREMFCLPDEAPDLTRVPLPAIVKPNFGDGSFAIDAGSVARTPAELAAALARVQQRCPGQPVLIQEFLAGAEYTVTLIGNPAAGFQTWPVIEANFQNLPAQLPPILGYESKFLPDSPYWKNISYHVANLSDAEQHALQTQSAALFERLDCRDYARFDFRRGADGVLKMLEVNPNPGWCWDGKMNIAATAAGLSYPDLLRRIIETALARSANARERAHYQATL